MIKTTLSTLTNIIEKSSTLSSQPLESTSTSISKTISISTIDSKSLTTAEPVSKPLSLVNISTKIDGTSDVKVEEISSIKEMIEKVKNVNVTGVVVDSKSETESKTGSNFDFVSKLKNVTDTFTNLTVKDSLKSKDFKETTSIDKYTAYKEITSIDNLKPEVIFVLNFLPLFYDDNILTTTGKYFSVQSYLRNIKKQNYNALLEKYDRTKSSTRGNVKTEFQESVNDLYDHISFLYNLIDKIDLVKEKFRLSSENNEVDIEKTILDFNKILFVGDLSSVVNISSGISNNIGVFSSKQSINYNVSNMHVGFSDVESEEASISSADTDSTELSQTSQMTPSFRLLPSKRKFSDILKLFGYDENTISKFHYSKVWLQSILLIRNLLINGTFNIKNPSKTLVYRNDKNLTTIVGDVEKNLFIENLKNQSTNSLFISSIKDLTAIDKNMLDSITKSFKEIDALITKNNVTTADMISDEMLFLSREFRYRTLDEISDPLIQELAGQQTKVNNSSNVLKYEVNQDTIHKFFNPKVGDSYTLMALNKKATPDGSLTDYAHAMPTSNHLVLTFEDSYVNVSLNGSYTPGTDFYVDSIFDTVDDGMFRTDRLKILQESTDKIKTSLVSLTNSLNLLNVYDSQQDKTNFAMSSVNMFADKLISMIIDETSGRVKKEFVTDFFPPLFSLASKNIALRSLLFLFFASSFVPEYNGGEVKETSASQFLAQDTAREIENLLWNNEFGLPELSSDIDKAQIYSSPAATYKSGYTQKYKKGTFLNILCSNNRFYSKFFSLVISFVNTIAENVITTETQKSQLINSLSQEKKYTKYSHLSEINILMIAFDMMCRISDQFINNKISGFIKESSDTTQGNKFGADASIVYFYNDQTFKNIKSDIINQVKKEESLVKESILTLVGNLSSISSSLKELISYTDDGTNLARLRAVSNVVQNKTLFKLLLDESQLRLISSDVKNLKSKAQTADKTNEFILDLDPASEKFLSCITAALKDEQFKQRKGFNKKVISVGIPVGIGAHLEAEKTISMTTPETISNYENDIVKIKVYKTDLQYPNIVFNPQEFLFELSRFTSENEKEIVDKDVLTFKNLIQLIPTYNIDSMQDINSSKLEYLNLSNLGNSKTSSSFSKNENQTRSLNIPFTQTKYSFLSDKQKEEIIRNHIMSFLMSLYISILTGMDIDERKFLLTLDNLSSISSSLLNSLTKTELVNMLELSVIESNVKDNFLSKKSSGSIFSSVSEIDLQTNWGVVQDTSQNKSLGSKLNYSKFNVSTNNLNSNFSSNTLNFDAIETDFGSLEESLSSILDINQLVTVFSSKIEIIKKFLYPRKFERVFNVVVDSDDFEINETETLSTQSGKKELDFLLSKSLIVSTSEQNTAEMFSSKKNSSNLSVKSKEKLEGDFSFEKYFIVIETLT